MLIFNVLQQNCYAESELDFFLYIYEMGQAISLVENQLKADSNEGVEGISREWVLRYLGTGVKHKDQAILQLKRFGVNTASDYQRWYEWWLDYLYTLNDVELTYLEKSRLNNEPLTEWYPEGHW